MSGTTRYVALLRGINVGKAKRIAMADLRSLVESLGHVDVQTLLNSGNVVFSGKRAGTASIAAALEAAIVKRFGFASRVVVVTGSELAAIVEANPLPEAVESPSRFLVVFVQKAAVLKRLLPLTEEDWGSDSLAVGPRAAYMACNGGILESRLLDAVARVLKDDGTSRNWATVEKLVGGWWGRVPSVVSLKCLA